MAGIFVVGAPVAILGVIGYAAISKLNKSKIEMKKDQLLKEAVAERNKIVNILSKITEQATEEARQSTEKAEQEKKRVEHLIYLNIAMMKIIHDLQMDLGVEEAMG